MGLDNFIQESQSKQPDGDDKFVETFDGDALCPRCLEPGEDTGRWYYRCKNDSCIAVTFVTTPN